MKQPVSRPIQKVRYIGSALHKSQNNPFGIPPALRSDASRCPNEITPQQAQGWLQKAFQTGTVSKTLEGNYPSKAWAREGDRYWEARLSNREQGEYHGYQIHPDHDDVPADVLEKLLR